ncbi:cytochrome P450 [Suillus hirtellus]|nr:cytochrome P450 [Suillus hirtellus]
MFSLKQGHRIFIVIGCHQAAMNIMEKEGANVADCLYSIAVHEMLSGRFRVILEGSTERVLHANLQPKVVETYEPMQTRHAKNVVLDILNNSKNHQRHVIYSASMIMSFTYGKITLTSYTDPKVIDMNRFSVHLGQAVRLGAYLVDAYPILHFVPGYLSQLKAWHREELAFYNGQLDAHEGTARPFFKQYQLRDKEVAFLEGVIFGASSDATASIITIMMMAGATHKDVQACIQEELNGVMGCTQLLMFADQDMLPQVTVFMLKSLRWRPVSLGGFVHRTIKDIIWKSYLIPEGVTVIGNHWAITNDPEVFPEPHRLNPQCWIDNAGHVCGDLWFFTFGFGHQVRPGQHLANQSVFINMALIMWAFHPSENSAVKIDTLAFLDTANIHAAPFEICFVKRINENVIRELCAPGK